MPDLSILEARYRLMVDCLVSDLHRSSLSHTISRLCNKYQIGIRAGLVMQAVKCERFANIKPFFTVMPCALLTLYNPLAQSVNVVLCIFVKKLNTSSVGNTLYLAHKRT